MIKITLVGDVMIGRLFNGRFIINKDHQAFSKKIKKHFKGSDVLAMNLETTLTDSETKYPNKKFNYKLSPKYAKMVLTDLSKNMFCSLANNHILDYEVEGLKETMNVLHDIGIHYTGAGLNKMEARRFVTINVKGTIVGFLSAADHYSYWNAERNKEGIWYINHTELTNVKKVLNIVKKAKMKCDILIFSCHMQPNYVDKISDSIKRFYRALISHGVDIVHGHSPHHVLPIEKYKNGYILYSLGDFVDDYAVSEKYRNDLGYLIDFWIKPQKNSIKRRKITKFKVYPTVIDNLQVDFLKKSSVEYDHVNRIVLTNPNPKIHVTGFGPFGRFKTNPSEKICKLLAKKKIVETVKIFDVQKFSSDVADKYFSDINQLIKSNKKILLLHFGLHPSKRRVNIERMAKNKFDGKKINKKLPIKHVLPTNIPLIRHKEFENSFDAGDWLCNYIYYRSLEFTNKNPNWFSLFVHLPQEKFVSIEDQYKIVKKVIKI